VIYFFLIVIVLAFVGLFLWLVADQERRETAAPPEPFDFADDAAYESARAEWAAERDGARKGPERT